MSWTMHHNANTSEAGRSTEHSRSRIKALIAEATTDSVDESDEHTGLLGTIREEVACPFHARLRGEDVECLRFEWPKHGYGLNAVCRTRTGRTRTVDIGDIEWVQPYPAGFQWIEAYLAWRGMLV